MQKNKIQILTIVSGVALIVALLNQSSAYGATSTIVVTHTPVLSFQDVPESLLVGTIAVPVADQTVTSDSDGGLTPVRYLDIQDTRNCGGLNLQMDATAFSTTPSLNGGLRVVTSIADSVDATFNNGVKYYPGFTGTAVTAPLNVADTTFSDPALFTDAPFDTVDNTLDGPIDLLEGPLAAPAGRNGRMHISLSYSLDVPKYTPAGDYYTTLVFTLADDTTGSC